MQATRSQAMPERQPNMSDYQQYFNETHNIARRSAKQFVEKNILPYINQWEEEGGFPRELYEKAGESGLLAIGYPEELGGVAEGDVFMQVAISEELMRSTSGGLVASLGSLHIGLPPIAKWATPSVKNKVVESVLTGKKISALAITEASGGSDVANIKTRAVREGDYYRVNGSKTFKRHSLLLQKKYLM